MSDRLLSLAIEIRTQQNLSQAMVELSKVKPSPESPVTFSLSEAGEARSLKQNRLFFLWIKIRGTVTGHGDIHERQTCKLLYGVPILRRDDEDFERIWSETFEMLPYENQLALMDLLPVTRLMKVKQFAELLDVIDRESAAAGIVLPKPDDLYYAALLKDAEQR